MVGKGHRLTQDDICSLVQFWKLDIKLEVLQASGLTLQTILGEKLIAIKRKLGCNYGTAVALVSFLRKLADGRVLAAPRTHSTALLDTALQHANCTALRQLFVAQAVADDVLFEIDLDTLAAAHEEIVDHLSALEQAIQGLRGAHVGSEASSAGNLLLKTE
eukprot:m.237156 g.237156  ORF g.237156 m.237156 type:complete len:161 (-) comp54330_c0_seq78:122-604(-)